MKNGLITVFSCLAGTWFANSSMIGIANVSTIGTGYESLSKGVGCDPTHFNWCYSTPKVNLWLYVVSWELLITLGFDLTLIPGAILYSKILGPRRQVINYFHVSIAKDISKYLLSSKVIPSIYFLKVLTIL